uniref:Uncharacterized protein n=1 Tax=viral metagenome TaxID=1070528 RepID=A0A6M3KXZ2_9ZZZZ
MNKPKTHDDKGISYEAKWIEAEMILDAISAALDGEEVSDFEMSFPIVMRVVDLVQESKKG